jgi:hypothetical protein
MYQISLYISSLLVNLFAPPPRVVQVEVIKEVEVRDPSGLIHNDLAFLRKHTAKVQWKLGSTLDQLAYQQGQADVLNTIETKVIGRRVDRP